MSDTYILADRVDLQRLAEDVRAIVGGTFDPETRSESMRAVFQIHDFRVGFSAGYGAKKHRIEVSAWAPRAMTKKAIRRPPEMPSITLDANRPLDAIARAIQTRVIDAAATPMAELRKLAEDGDQLAEQLRKHAAQLEISFPGIRIEKVEDGVTSVKFTLYAEGGKGSASGDLFSDGHATFQRVSVASFEGAHAVLLGVMGANLP